MGIFGYLLFAVTFLIVYYAVRVRMEEPVRALTCGLVIWTAALYLITEGLSLFHILTLPAIALCWLVLCVALLLKMPKRTFTAYPFIERFRYLSGASRVMSCVISLILIVMGWMAVVTIPYNYDSMTYHLPRIMMWIQNRSVAYYPTDIYRQLYSPALGEYVNLHVMLVCGTTHDSLLNLLQFMSVIVIVILLYSVLRHLQCRRESSLLGCLLFLTADQVIGQGISTMIDAYAAMWLMLSLYFAVRIHLHDHLEDRQGITWIILLAMSVGFTYLAKTNVSIMSLFIIIWVIVDRIKQKDKPGILFRMTMVAGFVILLMILPVWVRNMKSAGDVLASSMISGVTVGTLQPNLLLLNLYKNITTLLSDHGINIVLNMITPKIAGLLHADINAEAISFYQPFFINFMHDIDMASASLTTCIYFVLSLIAVVMLRKKKAEGSGLLTAGHIGILVSLLVIRWSPWNARFFVAVIMLMALISAYYYDRLINGRMSILYVFCLVLAIHCLPMLRYHVGIATEGMRQETSEEFVQMFRADPGKLEACAAIRDYVLASGEKEIGFYTGESAIEYPFMKVFHENGMHFEAVNPSWGGSYAPGIVISLEVSEQPDELVINGKTYIRTNPELTGSQTVYQQKTEEH